MITLLGSLIGFISSLFPELIKLFRNYQDHKHEVQVLQIQVEREKYTSEARLAEIQAKADFQEVKVLHSTDRPGSKWVESFSATVRPVIAYGMFGLYAGIKLIAILKLPDNAPVFMYLELWNEEDAGILAGILSYYFGNRAMQKRR